MKYKSPYKLWQALVRRMMGTVTHVYTQDPVVALTFDDGPHPDSTPRLLEILEKHQARATFFMLGKAARQYPDLVRRAAQGGHALGNHGWDHPSFPLISKRERWSQVRACEKALSPYGERLFRPPYGHQSLASRFDLLLMGYRIVAWKVVAYDWLNHDAEWMAKKVIERIKPGRIVLFHDVLYHSSETHYTDREPALKAVEMILERLGDRFSFITIPELFQHGPVHLQDWYREADKIWLNDLEGQYDEPRYYPP